MICTYEYKGKTFKSESELNDFLLEKDSYLSEFSDVVFSKDEPTAQMKAHALLEEAKKKAEAKKKEWDAEHITYNEDGARYEYKKPYMGVNEFLDGLTNSDSKLFFPEFIEHNYWSKRFLAWADGDYTDDEKLVFGFSDSHKPLIDLHPDLASFEANPSWDSETLRKKFDDVTTKEQREMRAKMELKWKNQAIFGDIVHFIGQKLFTPIKTGLNKDKLWIDVLDTEEDLFLKQIDASKYDAEKRPIREKFTDAHIREAIEYFKTLRQKLQDQLGDDLVFITEPAALGTLDNETKGVRFLIGRIDMVVIDKDGNAHIVDYKTSPKPYNQYNDAKKLGYSYQLAAYSRILAQNGLKFNAIRSFVAPIQLEGFRPDTDDSYVFDHIKADTVLDELTSRIRTSESIIKNLNEVLSVQENLTATSENLITKVDRGMKLLFPEYGKKKTEDEVRAMIEADKGFERRTDLEKPYGYFPKGSSSEPIVADSETELIKKVMVYYNTFQEQVKGQTVIIKNALKEGIKNNTTDVSLPSTSDENPAWLRNVLSKYLNNNWVVLEGDAYNSAEEFGVIFVQNKHTRHVEVITTSLNYLDYNPSKNPHMKNLTYGLGESDIVENSKPDSGMLEATNGNIRLMETMLVLNNMDFSDDVYISQIHVVNPVRGTGTWSPNEQLEYSFDKLMRLAKSQGKDVGENNLYKGKGRVKFANKAHLALLTLKNILNITGTRTAERFGGMASSISALDTFIQAGNREEVLVKLEELKTLMENDREIARYIKNPSSIIDESYHVREAVTAYAQVLWAIAEYKGYDFKQQLQDHDKVVFSLKGFKGLYWQEGENPGNYASNILNTASRVMQEAYQNVRDILSKDARAVNIAVEKLKEREGYSKATEYTIGNQSKLYSDIVYKTDDGDLMVKNPWDPNCSLSPAKIEFTKMFLMEINKDRFPNKKLAELEAMAKRGDYDFFKLPLINASKSGKAAQRTMFDAFKNRMKRFFDSSYYKDKVSDFLSEEEEINYKKTEEVFKMNNMMDIGNGPNRKAFMAKQLAKDPAYFEVDLENILLTHKQAYTIQREMDARMPIIKAAAFSLKMMGDYMGKDFSADFETIEKTVKSKIKNESLIEDGNMKLLAGVTKDLQQMASWMALAFAPVQASGQMLNGLFTNIKLNWTSDREIFSKEHLISSFTEVGKDIVHFGTKPTLCEAINKVFGINDMDMNTYAKNMSTNKHGIFHFMDRYAFKMSSRPDFYNRMTIFLSQMKADGCYEAHSLDADGNLKYDCTKDKRYKALWDGSSKNSKEYKEALARYIPVAQQFVKEGAKNSDGSLFIFNASDPAKLPRAYTVQESESRKDVADSLYGYYDHTKKALFFGTYLGSLLGQMRTYWSAKKNQYLATGGSNHIKGRYVQKKDDEGNLLFYKLKENGEVDETAWGIEDTGAPVMQWQGDYAEGVLVTLAGIMREVWNNDDKSLGGMMSTIREKFINNPDENYRRCYVTNLKILAYDMCMAIMLGALCLGLSVVYDDLEDDALKSEDLTDVILADMFGLVYKTFNYAKLDFFWWDSIFSPTIDWNPFMLSTLTNTIEQVTDIATGDKNAFDAMTQMFGFARQNRPIFKYLGDQTQLFDDKNA